MLLVSGLDKGLVIGSLIAGAVLFILAMISVTIFLAVVCLKLKQAMPVTNDPLQQEMMKEGDSITPHHGQLQSEDYEILSELKSNDAYIPINGQQQVSIETEENVVYHFNPTENELEHYYSNDQYDYEEIEDY
jgi:hypothetical protein